MRELARAAFIRHVCERVCTFAQKRCKVNGVVGYLFDQHVEHLAWHGHEPIGQKVYIPPDA